MLILLLWQIDDVHDDVMATLSTVELRIEKKSLKVEKSLPIVDFLEH